MSGSKDYELDVNFGQSNASSGDLYRRAYAQAMQGDPRAADVVASGVMTDCDSFVEFCQKWLEMPVEIQDAYQRHLTSFVPAPPYNDHDGTTIYDAMRNGVDVGE